MSKRSILIVEDESITAFELKMLVSRLGYKVAGCVDNADDALDIITDEQPRLVLMDINIKGDIDGIELTKQINQHTDMYVVYISAYSDDQTLERVHETRYEQIHLKPIDMRALQQSIQQVMARAV